MGFWNKIIIFRLILHLKNRIWAAYDSTQFKDFKQVKTTTVINKIDADNFNRENIRSSSLQKIRQVDRIKDWDWMLYRDAFRAYANTLRFINE